MDSTGSVGQYTSITAASATTLFVSYTNASNGSLKVAKSTNGGASWTLSTVDSVGEYTSIDAVSATTLFVSYYNAGNADLKVAKSACGGAL